jgi:hypothetical protein
MFCDRAWKDQHSSEGCIFNFEQHYAVQLETIVYLAIARLVYFNLENHKRNVGNYPDLCRIGNSTERTKKHKVTKNGF